MDLHIIACQVFYRELSYAVSRSPNYTRISWLPQGLHDNPSLLRQNLSQTLEQIQTEVENGTLRRRPQAIVLAYGLCSNGVTGIRSREIPLVIPRTDDCVALFLGSQQRYLELFHQYSGTYWLNSGWMESAFLPTEENYSKKREELLEQYGEENIDFLMEYETGWTKNYRYCGFISSAVFDSPQLLQQSQELSACHGWELLTFQGDSTMIQRLIDGDWSESESEKEFFLCPPWHEVVPSYDDRKFLAVPYSPDPSRTAK